MVPPLPPQLRAVSDPAERALYAEFLARMILSAIVGADRLDMEAFAAEGHPPQLQPSVVRSYATIGELRSALDSALDAKGRQAVLVHCRASAEAAAGAFSLDVATGGGKTLASLSFALRHAERHGSDRVIIVIPFTSIAEQTAAVYRQPLGRSV
jgi:CRISPR-associated endonuclease/helicase Cas3